MPNVTSETVEETIVFGGFTATVGCYCWLLLLLATCYCAPNAAADNRMPYLLLLLVDRTSNKSTCRQLAALLLLLVSRLTTKSTCRQQNTMPLKDEHVPELHGKMLNVTSETVEKTIVFGGFTATAGCYCHLLPATCAPNAAADNRMPYLLLLLVNRTSNKSTCRQQNTLPLKDELAPESPPKAPADSKTPCH